MGSCGEALPCEIAFEILTRSSLETIQKCKKVSKSMKEIIYEPTFLPLHCQRTNTLFGYLFQTLRIYRFPTELVSDDRHSRGGAAAIRANWLNEKFEILASSDEGILCCQRKGTDSSPHTIQYFACKPATNQWQELPFPILRNETEAAALVVLESNPLRYVILRLAWYGMKYKCEMYDSESWAWEIIECETPHGCSVDPHNAGVTVGQTVNWLTSNDDDVLSFDICERSFRCFPLPETAPQSKWKRLVEYEGRLGFMGLNQEGDRSTLELWVAEGRRQGWRRKKAVDVTALDGRMWGPQPVDLCSSEVAFLRTTEDTAGFYNLRDGSFSEVKVPASVGNTMHIFRFRSDFKIVDLRGGRDSL